MPVLRIDRESGARRVGSRRRVAVATAVSSLVAAPLVVLAGTAAPAAAADPVVINLIGVNDFHGRINTNTSKWATTVESLHAASATDTDIFVGAGDLIGASEFASAVQNDQPSIDVLNTLGLDASAVGNHEFDKGFADLRDRVIANKTNAKWSYLGANVFKKGTNERALPAYQTFTAGSLTVAVIGAVTQETPSLVSPAGVADLDFRDPIDSVNTVAAELSDGNAANGEADVLVASFHAGASKGAGSDYATEAAKTGEFAKMATLNANIDAIFNGHTHQVYAWDAPIPGEPGKTRPILQTGEYAANVGQIQLSVDPDTKAVTYTAKNHARSSTADLANPTVKAVDDIVKAALAKAAEVGNQPIGKLTADITRAYDGVDSAGKPVEDRGDESTLGDLVANALRDGIPADIAKPDLGIVNPGGLRADLTYAGATADNPANTDGVITYAEANNVLPFVNNIWTVELTGAELEQVLEQQWQPTGASRPYLHLGVSDNVEVTQDPTRPAGSRITSVRINDAWLDKTKVYKVSTFSFLGTGGDNFTAFKEGAAKDTGLVDRDLWIKYLKDHTVSPDFARQQVTAEALPKRFTAGSRVRVKLSKLDLTSVGAPANTTVDVVRVRGEKRTVLKTLPITRKGAARAKFTVPAADSIELVAKPSMTTLTRDVRRSKPKIQSVKFFPKTVKAGKTKTRVKVTVKAPNDGKVQGVVRISVGGRKYFAELTKIKGKPKSKAVVRLRSFKKPGRYQLEARYTGNSQYRAVRDTVTLRVKRR